GEIGPFEVGSLTLGSRPYPAISGRRLPVGLGRGELALSFRDIGAIDAPRTDLDGGSGAAGRG
ncbi:MAG: hypothetical protein OXS35_04570, partial [Dehalococcoidia bacterium]|nr:hypothetical protein [Dehalococcoidia bacterium]